jgi:hypothetical protein
MPMRWLALTTLAIVLCAPGVARAHQTAVTHVEVSVEGDDARVVVLTAPADVAEKPLDLPYDPPPTDDQLRAGAVAIAAHVTRGITLSSGDAPCTALAPFAEPTHDDGDFVRITWTARCPAPLERLAIEYDLFFDIDENHEAVLRVSARGEHVDTVLRRGEARFVWDLGEPPPSGTMAFIRSGIDHILFGFDHIAFVLTLLVAIVLARGDLGWRRRRFREALRATAWIVTSFTVAHSITLIAASLGYVSVAARVVESAIALSIAYTAVENIVKPDVPWRFVLTFAFGLIHGMGFARVLAVLLPPDDVIVPLLTFNVGVELGQLAIVALTLPLWWLLCGAVGPERYRRVVMPALSAILAVLGALWLAERLFEITILGF